VAPECVTGLHRQEPWRTVAGIYGSATAKKSILFIQALPAALAIAASLAG